MQSKEETQPRYVSMYVHVAQNRLKNLYKILFIADRTLKFSS